MQLSGTTLTSCFFSGNQIFTANCGDSRVILISFDEKDKEKQPKVKQLTNDHKPDEQKEK